MGYTASKKQAAAHKAFMTDGFKRGVLFWGRQAGKTFWSVNHAWISAVKDQGRYFIVFKTYKQAHEVVWRQYVPLIPKELIYKTNEADLLIELHYLENTPLTLPDGTTVMINHDKNKPRSTIQLLGSDQADSHRGFKANGIIFDEYADQDPDNWTAVYEPMFTTTNGWAVFMGTPRGYNHFYDMNIDAQATDDWFYQQATWRDSAYVSAEHIARAKRDADRKGTLSTFLQEYELEFRSIQGAVFPQFDRDVHVVKPFEIPEELTIYSGIDFGYHTTACLFVGIDKDQNWYVYDEVYGREEILKDIIPRIRQKLGEQRLVLMVGDSQAKDAIETMALEFPITPVVKRADSIIHGIDLIRTKLKPRIQLVGDPKPTLFISSVCKNFIKEIEAYKYPEEKKDRNPSELPMKEDDHGCFIASTTILTKDGPVFIDTIRAGDKVLTPFGEEIVINAQSMGVKKVKGYDRFIATPDHPILSSRGIAPVDALGYYDKVWLQTSQKQFTLTEYLIAGILTQKKEVSDFIFGALLTRSLEARLATSIEMSGNIIEEVFLKDILSTTLKDMTTTALKLSNLLQAKNTLNIITGENTKVTKRFSKILDRLRKYGIVPMLAESGIQNMGDVLGWEDRAWLSTVMCAVQDTILTSLVGVGSVLEDVKLRISDEQEVFNLATPSGMYFANGILVSNCDALRYLVLHLKYGLVKDDRPLEFEMTKHANEYGLI